MKIIKILIAAGFLIGGFNLFVYGENIEFGFKKGFSTEDAFKQIGDKLGYKFRKIDELSSKLPSDLSVPSGGLNTEKSLDFLNQWFMNLNPKKAILINRAKKTLTVVPLDESITLSVDIPTYKNSSIDSLPDSSEIIKVIIDLDVESANSFIEKIKSKAKKWSYANFDAETNILTAIDMSSTIREVFKEMKSDVMQVKIEPGKLTQITIMSKDGKFQILKPSEQKEINKPEENRKIYTIAAMFRDPKAGYGLQIAGEDGQMYKVFAGQAIAPDSKIVFKGMEDDYIKISGPDGEGLYKLGEKIEEMGNMKSDTGSTDEQEIREDECMITGFYKNPKQGNRWELQILKNNKETVVIVDQPLTSNSGKIFKGIENDKVKINEADGIHLYKVGTIIKE